MDYVALPKIELHAHFTGSISRRVLHDIWLRKTAAGETDLDDPLVAMPEDKHDYNIETFFPLFGKYIYGLLTDEASIRQAMMSVLQDFLADGVVYLELRTTPRATPTLSAEAYVRLLLDAMADFEAAHGDAMHSRLILSVDRRHTLETAESIADLACRLYRQQSRRRPGGDGGDGGHHDERDDSGEAGAGVPGVVGLDLCGDPTVRPGGDIAFFTPVFDRATRHGLGLTLHFAETRASASPEELRTLLAWRPRRLGHVICEDDEARAEIVRRRLCLELCLSCNVQADMVQGGFGQHHFKHWMDVDGPTISLGTDDVGVFGSPLSNEYRLVAEHFKLDRSRICALARQGIDAIFGGDEEKQRLRDIMWS
ncbi:hypothetical protein CDD83_10670 [Cordyceps sp. RAO-2017]|nr:hypothetical protein CDD83_10670 [Cordyceps sp. RAO-2017]